MRFLFLFVSFFCTVRLIGQSDKECRTNLSLNSSFEKRIPRKDTTIKNNPRSGFVDYILPATEYILRPPAEDYSILKFMLSFETPEGDWIETNCIGNKINGYGSLMLLKRKTDSPLYFTCIRVKHKSGGIYTIKPLTVYL